MGSPRRRLRVTMFGLLFAFSLFAGRLFQLQAVDAGGYAKAAATGREATAALHASRGAILAADGTPLAVSVEAYDVTADPTLVARYHEDVDELAAKLAGLFSAAPEYAQGGAPSVSDLQAALTKPNTRYVVLARKASPATCAKIRALAVSNTSNPGTVVGVYTNSRDDRRTYPGGTLAANLIGFTDSDGVGKAGIEQMLNARPGRQGRPGVLPGRLRRGDPDHRREPEARGGRPEREDHHRPGHPVGRRPGAGPGGAEDRLGVRHRRGRGREDRPAARAVELPDLRPAPHHLRGRPQPGQPRVHRPLRARFGGQGHHHVRGHRVRRRRSRTPSCRRSPRRSRSAGSSSTTTWTTARGA